MHANRIYVSYSPKMKNVEEILEAYLKYVIFTFGASRKILSDNGTEFKNKLFEEVTGKLGIERNVYSPAYILQANGRIEGFHKHLDWNDITHLATAAYYMPNQHLQESPYFFKFGRDTVTNFTNFITSNIKYAGDGYSRLKLDVMKDIYHLVSYNIQLAREGMLKY